MWQPGVTLAEMERYTILEALRFFRGHRTHTASSLGIALRTLLNRISAYEKQGIDVPVSPHPNMAGPRQPGGQQQQSARREAVVIANGRESGSE